MWFYITTHLVGKGSFLTHKRPYKRPQKRLPLLDTEVKEVVDHIRDP